MSLKVLCELHLQVYAKYPRFVREYVSYHTPQPSVPTHDLNAWQLHLQSILSSTPDDRTIVFVVDPQGNTGKTWFAKHFCLEPTRNHE